MTTNYMSTYGKATSGGGAGGGGSAQVKVTAPGSPFVNKAALSAWASANKSKLRNDEDIVTSVVVTDNAGMPDTHGHTYQWGGEDKPSDYDDKLWILSVATSLVTTVQGRFGDVVLRAVDIGAISESPKDGKLYGRKSESWEEIDLSSYVSDAPDNKPYVRHKNQWADASALFYRSNNVVPIRSAIEALSGNDRLDATKLKNLPASGIADASDSRHYIRSKGSWIDADTLYFKIASVGRITSAIEALTGDDRLDANKLKNLPASGIADALDNKHYVRSKDNWLDADALYFKTANISAITSAIEALSGEARLDASKLKNLPTVTSGGSGLTQEQAEKLSALVVPLHERDVKYVSNGGRDSSSGNSVNEAYQTFATAVTNATSDASDTNATLICPDASVFNESIEILGGDVNIEAKYARLSTDKDILIGGDEHRKVRFSDFHAVDANNKLKKVSFGSMSDFVTDKFRGEIFIGSGKHDSLSITIRELVDGSVSFDDAAKGEIYLKIDVLPENFKMPRIPESVRVFGNIGETSFLLSPPEIKERLESLPEGQRLNVRAIDGVDLIPDGAHAFYVSQNGSAEGNGTSVSRMMNSLDKTIKKANQTQTDAANYVLCPDASVFNETKLEFLDGVIVNMPYASVAATTIDNSKLNDALILTLKELKATLALPANASIDFLSMTGNISLGAKQYDAVIKIEELVSGELVIDAGATGRVIFDIAKAPAGFTMPNIPAGLKLEGRIAGINIDILTSIEVGAGLTVTPNFTTGKLAIALAS